MMMLVGIFQTYVSFKPYNIIIIFLFVSNIDTVNVKKWMQFSATKRKKAFLMLSVSWILILELISGPNGFL